jgi:DNA mismatch repair protein MutS
MNLSASIITTYATLRQQHPDCLLLMQVGTFLKVFDQDARTVSQVTGLALMMAGLVDRPVVTGGFPLSGLDTYVGKLLRAGHAVAIALQTAGNPSERLIREVIRATITRPGAGDGPL